MDSQIVSPDMYRCLRNTKYLYMFEKKKFKLWLPVKYCCMFKTETLVYNFLHSGSPSYFEPFLSLSSCSYSTRCSHHDHQYLIVPPFHSSVYKSVKHFGHSFAFDAPKIWNELPDYCVAQHQLPPSGKDLTCVQKPIRHSLPCQPCVSLV